MGNACLSGDSPTQDIEVKAGDLKSGQPKVSSRGQAPLSKRSLVSVTKDGAKTVTIKASQQPVSNV